jgi:hypothetical protein
MYVLYVSVFGNLHVLCVSGECSLIFNYIKYYVVMEYTL